MINIYVYRKREKIGETEYLRLIKKRAEKKHLLVIDKNAFIRPLSDDDELDIEVYYNIEVLKIIKLKIKQVSLIKDRYFEIECDYTPDYLYTYKQLHTDIFYAWKKNKPIDWRKGKSVSFKNAWIRCCCFLNGVKTEINLKREYVLNGLEINHPIDFFCLMGEMFMGKRGYMGAEGNAFKDCLNQLKLSQKNNSSKILITNYESMENAFSSVKGYEHELDYLLLDLSECGFKIIKGSHVSKITRPCN